MQEKKAVKLPRILSRALFGFGIVLLYAFASIPMQGFCPAPVVAEDFEDGGSEIGDSEGESIESHSTLHNIILYIPNRIFDLFDIFRLRARVGPGLGVGAHVTKLTDVFLGSYISAFVGLPGPRLKHTIPIPVGLESHNGASVSVVDATADVGIGPNYSPSEIGISIHLGIIGFDIGVDPYEVIDLGTGLVGQDIREDDL